MKNGATPEKDPREILLTNTLYTGFGTCGACGAKNVPLLPINHPCIAVCKQCVEKAIIADNAS